VRFDALEAFLKEAKRLTKKYPSLPEDIERLKQSLIEKPDQGILIRKGARKIRLAITSKGKGKSGGARVITYTMEIEKVIYLLYIYDKSDTANVPDVDIDAWISYLRWRSQF
jgi:hypothetical protein